MAALWRNHPRKILGAGVVLAGIAAADYLPNPFRTTGVQNIEKRYSSGGGAPNHTPAAATRRGDPDMVAGNVEKSKGMGTPHWEEHVAGQKAEPTGFDKTWNEAQYNTKKGK